MNDEIEYLDAIEQCLMLQVEIVKKRRKMLSEKSREKEDVMPEMIPVTDAMDRTGLSRKVITSLCHNGTIPHIRIGNHKILVNYGELRKYMSEAGRAS